MTDLLFPPWLRVSSQRIDTVSNSAASRAIFTGSARTVQRAGDRLRYGIRTDNANNRNGNIERAKLMSIRAQLRGQANRIWYSPIAYAPRGSFPATEKLDSSTFANGITNWGAGADATLSVQDRVFRMTRKAVTGTNGYSGQSVAGLTQYAPYIFRSFINAIAGGELPGVTVNPALLYDARDDRGKTTPAMSSTWGAASGSTSSAYLDNSATSGTIAGNYFESSFASVTRCTLVDNGQNLLTYSDQLDNAAWTKSGASITANAVTAPDGTSTADGLIENSATSTHQMTQNGTRTNVAADFCMYGYVYPASREVYMRLDDGAGNGVEGYVKATGAFSSANIGTGTNCRIFSQAVGGGFYYIALVGRLPAGTTVRSIWYLYNSGTSYAGNGVSGAYFWRCGVSQSSFPTMPAQTTAATTTGTLQTGSTIKVKGLPVSTSGLLLEGDLVQIGQQLVPVSASLNSDAAGLGTLQLAWPLRNAPADNDPVIINTPMGKFILTENTGGWDESPGIFSNHDFVLEEALDT
jgi:hypothetical protein